jgi:hypothetical protein
VAPVVKPVNQVTGRRLAIAVVALFCSTSTLAAPLDRSVRIFFDASGSRYVTGNAVPSSAITTILFTKEACSLAIDGAKGMLRAWQALGAYQVGCWYPTLDDNYVTIDGLGDAVASGAYWEILPRALLHPDGSATITEPNYDSLTFIQRIANEKAMRIFSRTREKP